MGDLTYPSIDIDSTTNSIPAESWLRGVAYAHAGRVQSCSWNAASHSLLGSIQGSRGTPYTSIARFAAVGPEPYSFIRGVCTCPMQTNCKHVAALIVTASELSAVAPEVEPERPWRTSLDALLPPAPAVDYTRIPVAIELTLSPNSISPNLTARLVRPGKRSGWVADDLAWSKLPALRHSGYIRAQLEAVAQIYTAYQASGPASQLHYGYSYSSYGYGYGDGKTISLTRFDSPQLWPLLDNACQVGVRLVQSKSGREVSRHRAGLVGLDVSADADGDLTVVPVLRLGDSTARPVAFIGSTGHGAAFADNGLHLAQLEKPVPEALQRMAITDTTLKIPAAEAPQFVAEYFPRLRAVTTITSTDASFTAPEVVGPTLVLCAAYLGEHELTTRWEWVYRLGDKELRAQHGTSAHAELRDMNAENALAARIEAPLEQWGLRDNHGALTTGVRLSGLDTMRFATEFQPILETVDGMSLEIIGEPADYRPTDDSLVISVSTTAVAGQTDWFDLGVTISIEGKTLPFVTVFTALAAGQSQLLLIDGAYFALNRPELVTLRNLIEEARALTDTVGDSPRISRFQAGLFDELAELGVVASQADEWRRQVEGIKALQVVESAVIPAGLQAQLRPYQVAGFTWLATLYTHGLGGILADDMGLGKTIQSLAFICSAREQDPDGAPFLIVAPASVVSNWASEAGRFAPELTVAALADTLRRSGLNLADLTASADVVVTSYTLFRLDFDAYAGRSWSGLILDEAQYVKNRQSKTYQCARKLTTPFKLAITGTPMENNLMELWSLLSITAPGLFPNPTAFADFFAKPIEKGGAPELLALFRRRIKPLVMRRTKELVAKDLPDKQEQVLTIELPARHRALYDKRLQRERQKVLSLLDDMQRNRFTIFKSLTALRQMALHPGLVDPENDSMGSAKIDVLVEQLRDVIDGGHRALVFSQFTRFLGKVRERLDIEGIAYCYLDGRTRNRAKAIARFKEGDEPVFLISLKAGGFGINLTEADYCFLLDPWWNPATEAQAIDRTHRIGQTRNVMVYRLIAGDTIEDKVVALSARKAALFTSVIDDGDAFGSALTAEDIRGFLE